MIEITQSQCPHTFMANLESIAPGALLTPASDGTYYWHLVNKTPDMGDREVIEAFRTAFDYISDLFQPLMVDSTSDISQAQIKITFANNGDAALPFPFESGVLAYAFAPVGTWAGKMYINEAIDWSALDKPGNIQLMKVVCHEILHLFNAGHSDNQSDIMYPYYQVGTPIVFTQDTINWIETNYADIKSAYDPGDNTDVIPEPEPEPVPTPSFPLSELFKTKKELAKLTERQLILIASYLGIEAKKEDLKQDTVDLIWRQL